MEISDSQALSLAVAIAEMKGTGDYEQFLEMEDDELVELHTVLTHSSQPKSKEEKAPKRDGLTRAILSALQRWPDDLQTARDWSLSLLNPRPGQVGKVRSRLEALEKEGLVRKVEHPSPSGKVTKTYFGLKKASDD